jgi:hypothetical protein
MAVFPLTSACKSRQHDQRKGTSLFRTKLLTVAGATAALVALGMTAAAASVSTSAVNNVAGIQANSVGCTSTTCVITASDTAGTKAKTALLNPANGSVKVTSWSSAAAAAVSEVACPNKTTCLALGVEGSGYNTTMISAISTQTGVEKVTAKLPAADQYNLFNIACPGSKYCWVDGNSAGPGVQLPTWALLVKVSPTGKILQRTVNKSYSFYGPVTCESSTTCLIGRETNRFKFQSMTLVNGKFGQARAYPANYTPFDASCYSNKLCYTAGVSGSTAQHLEVVSLNPKTGAPGTPVRLPFTDSTSRGISEGIACYSTTQCVVVGAISVGTGANQTTEAAYVVITKGKVGKPVAASKNLASEFDAVSCASPKECYAVGTYYISSIETTASIVAKV